MSRLSRGNQEADMAYVCDTEFIAPTTPAAKPTSWSSSLASLPRRALAWLAAWNEAADERAGRTLFGRTDGKITDAMEREMMRRVLGGDWSPRA